MGRSFVAPGVGLVGPLPGTPEDRRFRAGSYYILEVPVEAFDVDLFHWFEVWFRYSHIPFCPFHWETDLPDESDLDDGDDSVQVEASRYLRVLVSPHKLPGTGKGWLGRPERRRTRLHRHRHQMPLSAHSSDRTRRRTCGEQCHRGLIAL